MHKYLYFSNSTTDAAAVPSSLLRQMRVNSTSTAIDFEFEDVQDGIGNAIVITVSITTDKPKEVVQAVSDEIRYGKRSMIIVADDLNSDYIHPDVTAVSALSLT